MNGNSMAKAASYRKREMKAGNVAKEINNLKSRAK